MPATIKPRRGSGAPTSTSSGELLVDTTNNRVLIGTGPTAVKVIGSASHGSTAGLLQFRGANSGEFLSSNLFGTTLSGSTPTAVFLGANGSTPIPLNFYTQTGTVQFTGFRSPASITVPAFYTTTPTEVNYVLPATLPNFALTNSHWALLATAWNSQTSTMTLNWTNICNLCSTSTGSGIISTGGSGSGTAGIGVNGLYGQVLISRAPTTDDDPNVDIYVAVADNNDLRYDTTSNKLITRDLESTGLVLKTGNTGKVKFVAESFAGSEVTVTVPSTASGGTVITTNNKISDLSSDTWGDFSAKLSGKQGSGDVVQKTSPTITTPTIENTLTLSDTISSGFVGITAASGLNCEIFNNTAVSKITIGSLASDITLGGTSTGITLAGDTFLSGNIFTVGGAVAPLTDTNKDKGVRFRWHNGTTAKTGFFGYDDSSGKFIFVPDATISSDVVSGSIGEINAQLQWSNILSVPAFATSSNNLGYFASTTSSQLAGVISDETGSGALVFGTTPSFTTGINAASTAMDLFNTTAATINFGGAATAINIGSTTSGTVTIGYNLYVTNKLEATIKSFVINHPTKIGKKLRYACLEGPENGVYVRGELNNQNTIELPEYWVNLVDEDSISVNLTGIGKAGYHTVKEIKDNKIIVEGSTGFVNCYYVVYGERKDVSKLVTEFE